MNSLPANQLPAGSHPGFAKLKSQKNVFRGKLRFQSTKSNPAHADYVGSIFLDGGRKALAMIWVHQDGTLGLRIALRNDSANE
jgi:hypothetical protein